jgi:uncharacterized protein YigA (DUF484 family)
VRTHQLTLALMKQDNAADTLRAMAASLQEDFAGDLVRLVVHTPVAGLEQADWLQVIAADDPQLGPFRDCLNDGEPICGRLQPEKNAVLYGVRSEEVQTTALLPLPGVGLIAVGSHDPNRFYPGMGTLFLRMMGDALVTGLKRFGAEQDDDDERGTGLPAAPAGGAADVGAYARRLPPRPGRAVGLGRAAWRGGGSTRCRGAAPVRRR